MTILIVANDENKLIICLLNDVYYRCRVFVCFIFFNGFFLRWGDFLEGFIGGFFVCVCVFVVVVGGFGFFVFVLGILGVWVFLI